MATNNWRGQWVASPPGGYSAGDQTLFGGTAFLCNTTGTTSQPGTDGTWTRLESGAAGGGSSTPTGALQLPELPADPAVNPVGGPLIYAHADGSIKARSPGGTVTTIAPA